jgi:hypothetical protein
VRVRVRVCVGEEGLRALLFDPAAQQRPGRKTRARNSY